MAGPGCCYPGIASARARARSPPEMDWGAVQPTHPDGSDPSPLIRIRTPPPANTQPISVYSLPVWDGRNFLFPSGPTSRPTSTTFSESTISDPSSPTVSHQIFPGVRLQPPVSVSSAGSSLPRHQLVGLEPTGSIRHIPVTDPLGVSDGVGGIDSTSGRKSTGGSGFGGVEIRVLPEPAILDSEPPAAPVLPFGVGDSPTSPGMARFPRPPGTSRPKPLPSRHGFGSLKVSVREGKRKKKKIICFYYDNSTFLIL